VSPAGGHCPGCGRIVDPNRPSAIHSLLKNRICEEAKPSEIKAHFHNDEIETSSMLQAYNDVLPFGNTFRVAVGNTEYLVLDQFCVRSGCKCTDVHLILFPIEGEGRAVEREASPRMPDVGARPASEILVDGHCIEIDTDVSLDPQGGPLSHHHGCGPTAAHRIAAGINHAVVDLQHAVSGDLGNASSGFGLYGKVH
jgi:hypothetical protein